MPGQTAQHKTEGDVPLDIPRERGYDRIEDADLDTALVNAIEAAEAADDEYLAELLTTELGSHYHSTR